MIVEHSLPHKFWAEAVSTACHMLNRCLIRPILKKTPYELWNGNNPTLVISIHSGANILFTTMEKTISVSLMHEAMKVYFLDTQTLVDLIESLISVLYILKNLFMLFLMILTNLLRQELILMMKRVNSPSQLKGS